jgi:hypothetical protein
MRLHPSCRESSQRTGRRFVAPEDDGMDRCRIRQANASVDGSMAEARTLSAASFFPCMSKLFMFFRPLRTHACLQVVGLGSRPVAEHLPIGARFGADAH